MGFGEADTRAKLIDPAIHACGWTEDLIKRHDLVVRTVKRGLLPCFKMGKVIRFKRCDVEEFLERSRVGRRV